MTPQQFWEMPFCSLFFFAKVGECVCSSTNGWFLSATDQRPLSAQGFFFTDDSLGAVNVAGMATDESSATEFSGVPVAEIVLEHPREPVTHELLDCDMNPVQPDRQPGSFVFTQVGLLEDPSAPFATRNRRFMRDAPGRSIISRQADGFPEGSRSFEARGWWSRACGPVFQSQANTTSE